MYMGAKSTGVDLRGLVLDVSWLGHPWSPGNSLDVILRHYCDDILEKMNIYNWVKQKTLIIGVGHICSAEGLTRKALISLSSSSNYAGWGPLHLGRDRSIPEPSACRPAPNSLHNIVSQFLKTHELFLWTILPDTNVGASLSTSVL